MDLLRPTLVASLAALGACYSPDFRDCSVTCAATTDCASGQVCGTDRLCAGPELAGRCASQVADAEIVDPRPDGRPPSDARPPADASTEPPSDAPRPDAAVPAQGLLHVKVSGAGNVDVVGIGVCGAAAAPNAECTYTVTLGVVLSLKATANPDATFDKWSTTACANQGPICSLTPVLPSTDVQAKFREGDD